MYGLSVLIGLGVADHIIPLCSSLIYIISPDGSSTGSFDQVVSLFSLLFTAQVVDAPDSVIKKPKCLFAITLLQGSGVFISAVSLITYSLPSLSKPPYPLKF